MANPVEILLKNGMTALVDPEDFESLSQFVWYAVSSRGTHYAKRGKNTRMHREILGLTDSSLIVDHINGNGLDNRKCNLRVVDVKTNVQNRQRSKAGNKCPGVFQENGKWRTQVTIDYKKHYLGSFFNEDDAIAAVNKFRAKHGRPEVIV